MDLFTSLTLVMTAGKVTHTMDVAWVWVLAPLYLRASLVFAYWVTALFNEERKDE